MEEEGRGGEGICTSRNRRKVCRGLLFVWLQERAEARGKGGLGGSRGRGSSLFAFGVEGKVLRRVGNPHWASEAGGTSTRRAWKSQHVRKKLSRSLCNGQRESLWVAKRPGGGRDFGVHGAAVRPPGASTQAPPSRSELFLPGQAAAANGRAANCRLCLISPGKPRGRPGSQRSMLPRPTNLAGSSQVPRLGPGWAVGRGPVGRPGPPRRRPTWQWSSGALPQPGPAGCSARSGLLRDFWGATDPEPGGEHHAGRGDWGSAGSLYVLGSPSAAPIAPAGAPQARPARNWRRRRRPSLLPRRRRGGELETKKLGQGGLPWSCRDQSCPSPGRPPLGQSRRPSLDDDRGACSAKTSLIALALYPVPCAPGRRTVCSASSALASWSLWTRTNEPFFATGRRHGCERDRPSGDEGHMRSPTVRWSGSAGVFAFGGRQGPAFGAGVASSFSALEGSLSVLPSRA